MRTVISLAAALAMAAAPAMTPRTEDPGDRPMDDRLFAQAAAASGLAEISLARIAVQEGQDGEVKNYAAKMVEDHTRASQRLAELAAAKQIALPTELGIQDQATAVALSGGPGLAFDRGYLQQQVAAHIVAVALFRAEAERGRDPELRAFARETLPTLIEHFRMARTLADSPGVTGGSFDPLDPPARP